MNTTKEAKKSQLTGEKRTDTQKASDAKRVEKIKATRASRKNSDAITRELKIDWSKLSQRKRHLINCGAVLDRQSNAAFVILALGLSQYVPRYASDRLIDDYARGIAPVFLPSGSAHTVVSWASSFDSVFQKEWKRSKRRREILTAVRDDVIRGWYGCGTGDAVRLCLVQIHRLACLSPLLHADKHRAIRTDTRGALASREHEANGASPEAQGFSLG